MILITDLSSGSLTFDNSVITLGNFDGLHLGHQELIRMVITRAKEIGGKSIVVTFRPHPLKVLAPEKCPPLISIYEEKIRLFEKLGVDVLVKIPFSLEFASITPRDFVKDILSGRLGAREIFVGFNYRFGRGREGNTESLKELGREFGFIVHEVKQISINGEVISSTLIRQLLIEGEVEHAAKLLGRFYAVTGVVVKGDSRGKKLGFPTANIAPKHAILPDNGVYAVTVYARDRHYKGVANIGSRPTFDKRELALEVHIFDFNEDLYGEEISVFFVRKIRDEKKFSSPEELVAQIKMDVDLTRDFMGNKMDPSLITLFRQTYSYLAS